MMHPIIDFNVPALSDLLSDAELSDLLRSARPIHYSDGQLIHMRGDARPGLSVIREGSVALGTIGVDGSERIISILGPNQSFGEFTLFADLPRTHDATAIGETIVEQISRPVFEAFIAQHPRVLTSMLTATTQRLHGAVEFIEDLRRLPSDVHIAKWLASVTRSENRQKRIAIKQSQIGRTLGLSRVSVNKALKSLEARKLIATGYGYIEIIDLNALENWYQAQSSIESIT